MKIFPCYWGRKEAEFEVVATPDSPCAGCEDRFHPQDIGIIIPYVFGPPTAVDPGGVGELPWHRSCFLQELGIVEKTDDVFPAETYTVDMLKKET